MPTRYIDRSQRTRGGEAVASVTIDQVAGSAADRVDPRKTVYGTVWWVLRTVIVTILAVRARPLRSIWLAPKAVALYAAPPSMAYGRDRVGLQDGYVVYVLFKTPPSTPSPTSSS
ncbi:protein of unknown function [Modestobacter italicus]|uniref:Uncharacterized protein n=1 Tax=Modestobacter italicus (strain DSM 44449 / CECT 9708 / BC 501) TaxID=2732864 RepID=I4F0I9_MODI5|nr:hypothetical protein [Modestobacter marinus]CCH89152.1 protein of unknown function [Modestobacter marinus]